MCVPVWGSVGLCQIASGCLRCAVKEDKEVETLNELDMNALHVAGNNMWHGFVRPFFAPRQMILTLTTRIALADGRVSASVTTPTDSSC